MFSQLVLIHSRRTAEAASRSFEQLSSNCIVWETCLRRIALGTKQDLSALPVVAAPAKGVDVYESRAAKKFLLEIVCGLHSPVRGETEVHGQYRDLLDKIPSHHELYLSLQSIHREARLIRAQHLQGLGSQSYGSIARRKLRKAREVHILGAGALTKDVLPWLCKLDMTVKIYYRSLARVHDEISKAAEKHQNVQLHHLDEGLKVDSHHGAMLVSAPMASENISRLMAEKSHCFQTVLDYRGESNFDPVQFSGVYLTLQDIFREIESTKEKVELEVERARMLIHSLCH